MFVRCALAVAFAAACSLAQGQAQPPSQRTQDRVQAVLKAAHLAGDFYGAALVALHKTILPRRARPYRLENGALQNAPWDDSGSHFSAGGMYSTVRDLYRWDRALRAGSVVSKPAQVSMTTPVKGEAWNVFGFQQYGLGWWLKTHETLGRLAMHPGASPQYSAVVVRGLDRDLVIVALANVSSVPSMNKVVPALIEAVAVARSPN